MTEEGDLPMMYTYDALKFDIKDIIGHVDLDDKGNMIKQKNPDGDL